MGCLFVREVFTLVFNSHSAQSTRFCSKRIFLLVNATQLDLASLQSLGPVLVHPPTNQLYAWPREPGKKNFVAQKEIDWVCICSWGFFYTGFQLSSRTINKILFQTHLLTCKCHPVRFSVSHYNHWVLPCTSTPTPKLILRVATRAGKKENLCWRKKK